MAMDGFRENNNVVQVYKRRLPFHSRWYEFHRLLEGVRGIFMPNGIETN